MISHAGAAALVEDALGRMSPRAAGAVADMREVFCWRITRDLRAQAAFLEELREETDLDTAIDYVLQRIAADADAFKVQRRALRLAALSLGVYTGGGVCPYCQGAGPTEALSCCGRGMHRRCWVAWRLSEPQRCLLCQSAL